MTSNGVRSLELADSMAIDSKIDAWKQRMKVISQRLSRAESLKPQEWAELNSELKAIEKLTKVGSRG